MLRRLLSWIYPPTTLHQPDSMTLATATKEGRPSARIVLFKGINNGEFVFYTNYDSRKGRELEANPFAALVFHWGFPERQIRVEGVVKKISREDSCAYWNTRSRGSQISGMLSEQSRVILSRDLLVQQAAALAVKHQNSKIPCPDFWGGYSLQPNYIEFWEGRLNRLHDRILYTHPTSGWKRTRQAP